MKIALVNNFSPITGIGKYAFNLYERMREEGMEVEMLYLESKDNPLPGREGIHRISQGFHFPIFNKTLSWAYYFPKRIPTGYGLYHASSHYLTRIAKYRNPTVVTHMDLAPFLFPKDYPFLLRRALSAVLKEYRRVARVLAISENSKRELVERGYVQEERVDVVHPGCDERLYRPMPKEEARRELRLPPDKRVLLHVGSEERRKNLPTLLRAMKCLAEERDYEDLLLVRVGEKNRENDELKKGLEIRHFSNVEEEKMPLFYSASDLFVFPSSYEGNFAYPPLEAMACGTPTLVSEALELFREGCYLYSPHNDPAALAKGIEILLSSPETYRKLALREARRFTLQEEVKRVCTIYREVLEEEGRGR
jgi:glycosyltransferase involved in cell wall biosynthesis